MRYIIDECSRLFCLVALLSVAGCATYIEIEGERTVEYAVHGYVDAQVGIYVDIVRAFDPGRVVSVEEVEAARVTDAEVTLRPVAGGGSEVRAEMIAPGRYVYRGALPFGDSIHLRVEVAGTVMEVRERIPARVAVRYDSISTVQSSEDLAGNQLFNIPEYVIHRGKISAGDEALSLHVRPPEPPPQTSRFMIEAAPDRPANGCLVERAYAQVALSSPCVRSGVGLGVGGAPDSTGRLRFLVSQSYQEDFPIFLASLEQFSSSDFLSGLYEIIPAPTNVRGGGGYVYVSSSVMVSVRP